MSYLEKKKKSRKKCRDLHLQAKSNTRRVDFRWISLLNFYQQYFYTTTQHPRVALVEDLISISLKTRTQRIFLKITEEVIRQISKQKTNVSLQNNSIQLMETQNNLSKI